MQTETIEEAPDRKRDVREEQGDLYAYVAQDSAGKILKGRIKARSLSAAIRTVEKKSLIALSVEKAPHRFTFSNRKWNSNELIFLFREISVMCNSGLSLKRSIEILHSQSDNPYTKDFFHELITALENGKSFSDAMTIFPKIFSKFHRSMIKASEEGGFLTRTIEYLSDVVERELSIVKRVKSALIYPLMLFIIGTSGCLGVFYWIFPYLKILVSDMGVKLPFYTQVMMTVAEALRSYYVLLPLVIVLCFASYRLYLMVRGTIHGQIWWEKIIFRVPGVKEIVKMGVLTHSLIMLSSLTRSGVHITSAIELAGETCDNHLIGGAFQQVASMVRDGRTIAESMQTVPSVFPPTLIAMVSVGEESGEIPHVLDKTAYLFELQLSALTENFTKLIEPMAIMILGLMIGGMLLSFFIPIYSSINTI
ncbi:MAG: type II secretion system F family protein [Candidatus Xenobiia bacterium LiM19]